MNVFCPQCRRGTSIDSSVGDFPTRCNRCGTMVRLSASEATAQDEPPLARAFRVEPAPYRRVQRGALAGMLLTRPRYQAAMAGAGAAVADYPASSDGGHAVLLPESRQEISRAHARLQALKRAQLRGNHEALGALGWVGLGIVAVLAVVAIALKTQDLMRHSANARADVLQVR